MDGSPDEQELNRIEREMNTNNPPGEKPPVKRSGGNDGVDRMESQAKDLWMPCW